jgi:RNA:NAD 2'-phosphotransferase (TPT1/KptA family)
MITFKKYLTENQNVVYHITRTANLLAIKRRGIVPNIPTDYNEDQKAVYLFPSQEDYENALENWLGDRYDEDEELVVLTIDTQGLNLKPSSVEYELLCFDVIPPQNIIKVDNI